MAKKMFFSNSDGNSQQQAFVHRLGYVVRVNGSHDWLLAHECWVVCEKDCHKKDGLQLQH